MKSIHLELVRVTESAAISASGFVGRGDKIAADFAATEAMRKRLNRIPFSARIAIGEGVKDNAPGLFHGEGIGLLHDTAESVQYDIAVDPLDGTTQVAKGGSEAMSVIALANKGCFYESDAFYMNKLAYGAEIASKAQLSITDPISRTLKLICMALKKEVNCITVCLLDRPRHTDIICELRRLGTRIKLISDCDVSAAIATALPDSGIDLYMGIGGAPECVISAAALKCLGGIIQAQVYKNDKMDSTVLDNNDLAKGETMFSATGVTDGSLLRGVRYYAGRKKTHSILMRSESGTVRFIETLHGN